MKKIALTTGTLLMCLSIQAQFYLKGYTGYSLATGGSQVSYFQTTNGVMDGASASMKFGQGVNLGLCAGYSFNKNFALEITGNTQLFSGLNFSVQPDFDAQKNSNWSWATAGCDLGENKTTNQIIQWAPLLVFSSNPYNNWIFYLKGGPDFLYAKYTISRNSNSYKFPFEFPFEYTSPSENFKQEYSGRINIGAQFSAGMEYSFKDNIRFFAEITTVNVQYKFKKYKILQYEINDTDVMSDLDNISGEMDDKANFNHIGLNVGLKFIFR
jgi:hypothetical protein